MNPLLKLFGIVGLGLTFLIACNDGGTSHTNNQVNASSKTHKNNTSNSNKKNGETTDSNNNVNRSKTKKPGPQLNLKIGGTANIKSNISHYMLTLNSVKIQKSEINGLKPQLDQFIVAGITLKNVGNKTIKSEDAIGNLILTEDLKASGTPDEALQLGITNAIKGKLKPGEAKTGDAVFEAYKAKKYFLVNDLSSVGTGLINNIRFTFKASEAQ